jgi:hypothetical protein
VNIDLALDEVLPHPIDSVWRAITNDLARRLRGGWPRKVRALRVALAHV